MSKKKKKAVRRKATKPPVEKEQEPQEEPQEEPAGPEGEVDTETEEEGVEEKAVEEKHYLPDGDAPRYRPTFGATSFAELEAARAAQEQAEEVAYLTDDLQRLISNIMYNDSIEDKAAAIADLVQEFSARAQEAKTKSFLEDPVGFVKAKLSRASINNLPDSAFAYIEPGGKKDESGRTVPRSLRHYPIHDAAHAKDALGRAAQQIKKGGKKAAIARKALPKIRAAAKRLGVSVEKKDNDKSLKVFKDSTGNWRWLGVFTNNYQDRSGDILTEKAHREFIAYLDANPQAAPLYLSWHTPGTQRKARADFWDYTDEGFMVFSGPLTEQEAEALITAKSLYELGMSHGFFVLKRDPANSHLILKYRTFEVSDLPLEMADNPWTAVDVIGKEVTMPLSKAKRKYLVDLFGEEKVAALEGSLKEEKDILDALGVNRKDAEPDPEKPAGDDKKTEDDEEETPAPDVKAFMDALDVDGLNEFLTGLKKQVETLASENEALKKEVAALKEADDDKMASLVGAVPPLVWQKHRASASGDSELTDEEKKSLKQKRPGADWLAEAFGATATQ